MMHTGRAMGCSRSNITRTGGFMASTVEQAACRAHALPGGCSIEPRIRREKVMQRIHCFAVAALGAAFGLAYADETCNSPYISKLIKGQEDYVYVWTLGVEGLGDGSDKLVTVDVNPKSKSYGKVISSVSTGTRAEAHHMGF